MARKRKQPKWFDEYVSEDVAQSTLFKFKIELPGGKKIDIDMRADLDVDYSIIQEQLSDVPSEFAYWAAIYSELKMQVAKIERTIKARRGKLVEKIVREAHAAAVRMTDKQVQSVLEADSELNQMEARLMLANKHAGKMYFMVEAIKMKSDSLRSLSGFARIEMSDQR